MPARAKSAPLRSATAKMPQFRSRSRKFRVLSPSAGCWPFFAVTSFILSNFSSSTTSTPGKISRSNSGTHRWHCTDESAWPVSRLTCGSPGNVANSNETKTNVTQDANGMASFRSQSHSSRLWSFGPNSRRGRAVVRLSWVHSRVHSKSCRVSRTSGQSTNAAATSSPIKKRCVQVTR